MRTQSSPFGNMPPFHGGGYVGRKLNDLVRGINRMNAGIEPPQQVFRTPLVDNSSANGNGLVVADLVATSPIGLSGSTTIDGTATSNGMIVLAQNQSTTAQNGLWVVTGSTWTKYTPFNPGLVIVKNGTNYTGTQWYLSAANNFTLLTAVYA